MIVRTKIAIPFCLLLLATATPSVATADGPRIRLFQNRTHDLTTRTSGLSNRSTPGNRNGDSNRSTIESNPSSNGEKRSLPSGRNYYQGRYYGNFNNRFYGPQYGYF